MKYRRMLNSCLQACIAPAVFVVAWEALVRAGMVPEALAARPSDVALRLAQLIGSCELLKHLAHSIVRLAAGVVAGVAIGVTASLLLVHFRPLRKLLSPSLQFVAGVPVVLWMPFCAMLFGIGELFKIALTTINTSIILYVLVLQALMATERAYAELADMYEKTYWQRVRELLLPSAMPAILVGARTALAFGWIVLFFVEYGTSKSGQEGLAWFIANARAVGRVEDEFAGLIFLGIIAFVSDTFLGMIQQRTLHWRDTMETDHEAGIQ